MFRFSMSVSWFTALLVVFTGISLGQDRSTPDDGWTPDLVYGKGGKDRTSQPFVVRRYKVDPEHPDKVDRHQPPNFVKTISDGYKLADDEAVRVHLGVDLPSRPDPRSRKPEPMEYKAGVYGKVVKAGGGQWNTITVQLNDGSMAQYLHSSAVFVKKGQQVTPDTKLGLTGKAGLAKDTAVHLHIQAKDKDGKPISPDKALGVGRRRPATTIEWPEMKWVDVDIEASSVRVPNVKVVDRTVRITFDEKAPRVANLAGTTWVGVQREGADQVAGASDTWEFQEKGQLRFSLKNDIDGERISQATWTQDGTSVTVKFDSGTLYAGVIKGDLITGEASWTHQGKKRTAP